MLHAANAQVLKACKIKPPKPRFKFGPLPDRKTMAFMPCFVQHETIKQFTTRFREMCKSQPYAHLVSDIGPSDSGAFVITQETLDTWPEISSMPLPTFYFSEVLTFSLCNGTGECCK